MNHRFYLPLPPSTNTLYPTVGKRRIKSAAFLNWQDEAGKELISQRPKKWNEPVYITIIIGKLRSDADVSNRIKALEDLLVTHCIIPNDNMQWVKGVHAYMAPKEFVGVEVIITPTQMQAAA